MKTCLKKTKLALVCTNLLSFGDSEVFDVLICDPEMEWHKLNFPVRQHKSQRTDCI